MKFFFQVRSIRIRASMLNYFADSFSLTPEHFTNVDTIHTSGAKASLQALTDVREKFDLKSKFVESKYNRVII